MTTNPFDLSGKVAIVTGTSRGLGQYLGRALARAGADLVITARKRESLRDFQREIESLGRRAVPLELDVRDYDSIQRMARGGRRRLWQDRHPRQQRRLQCPQARRRYFVGRLEPGPRHQPPRHILRRAGRRPHDDPPSLRPDHQHRLGHLRFRLCRACARTVPAAAAVVNSR